MGCQKAIAKKIIAGGGDYLLTVKGAIAPHRELSVKRGL
jgi:hypothetical protein